ncbi:MAG: DUF3179 domain-containing (seleno)protein [Tepidisphaerales bacterium]
MLLPLLLAAVSVTTAAVAAYGTSAAWVDLWGDAGLTLIYLSRRLQWPLLTVCVLSAAALVTAVAAGKTRAWWLIGLLPVLALFAHRFATSPMRDFRVLENPPLVALDVAASSETAADGLSDDDFVVGVVVPATGAPAGGPAASEAIAYPYALLYRSPMIVQSVREQRIAVLWSPFANFARAYLIDRDLNPREIEPVSLPANATLLYNARYGEFINTVSGLTQHGRPPTGFRQPLPVSAMTFGRWRALYPESRVAVPPPRTDTAAWRASVPVRPRSPLATTTRGAAETQATETPVVVVGGGGPVPPIVLLPSDVSNIPLNLDAGGVPLVVLRDPATLRVRAFQRRWGDTTLRFALTAESASRTGTPASGSAGAASGGAWAIHETETGTRWSARGVCIEPSGPWAGRQLAPVGVFEGAYFEVLRYWMPELQVHHVTAEDFVALPPPTVPEPPAPATRPARRPSGQRR